MAAKTVVHATANLAKYLLMDFLKAVDQSYLLENFKGASWRDPKKYPFEALNAPSAKIC